MAGADRDWRINVLSDGEGGRGLEVVPVLLGEAIGAVVSVKGSLCGMRAVVGVCVDGGQGPSMSDGAANRLDSRVGALLQALLAL